MSRAPTPVLVCCAVGVLLAGGLMVPGVTNGVASGQSDPAVVRQQGIDADTVSLRFDVRGDGTAAGRVTFLVALDDENDTAAFEDVAADIRTDPDEYTQRFRDRLERTVATGENVTGRSMRVANVSVTTGRQTLGQEYGVVRYTYTWHGFAATNDTTISIGDALAGYYLDGRSRLAVGWPDGYAVRDISPSPEERADHAVIWTGPRDFGPAGPRVTLTAAPSAGSGLPVASLALSAVVLVAVGAVAVAYRRGAFEAFVAVGGGGAGSDDRDAPADQELLSNEERVLTLLDDHDGRMKQQAIAEELDWTDAKTSQVVTDLRERGAVEVFRLGRENVVARPDETDI